MNENDLVRLKHMRDAAREVVEFTTGRTREPLNHDRLLMRGLTKTIEIIGEAAAKLSPEFQDATPEIPWAQIIGMRNRLVHGYFDINLDRLWETATLAVPQLLVELEKLIPPEIE